MSGQNHILRQGTVTTVDGELRIGMMSGGTDYTNVGLSVLGSTEPATTVRLEPGRTITYKRWSLTLVTAGQSSATVHVVSS